MTKKIQKYKHYLPTKYAENSCPNCGTKHQGLYCYNCGQSVNEVKKPLKDFLFDVLGTLYAFDIKFWHSIKVLFTKPEKLSSDFISGKRAGYTPPFKLYFFVSFIFFFIVNWQVESEMDDFDVFEGNDSISAVQAEVKDSIIANVNTVKDNIWEEAETEGLDSMLNNTSDSVSTEMILGKKNGWFDFSESRIKRLATDKNSEKLFVRKALKYSSWLMFLLMPLLAFFFMALHYRREKFYVSHLIFAVNTQTLIFLILTLTVLLDFSAKGLLLLLIPFYLIRSMKKYYNQSWSKAILKFFILTTLYNFVLLAAIVVLFVLTIGTY